MYSSISIQEQSLDLLGTFPTMLIVSNSSWNKNLP